MKSSHIRSVIFILIFIAALLTYKYGRGFWVPVVQKISGEKTVEDVVKNLGDVSRSRLHSFFADKDLEYPPKKITFIALKREKVLEVWASDGGNFKFVTKYPILKTSGVSGPKLREGDRQVPEGIYRITSLNPNSSYHLSIKLNYPNEFDLHHARKENRTQPGSNIFIHGKDISIGCLAMGDQTIEDLFVLVHDVGKTNVQVIISPYDPRISPLDSTLITGPEWLPELYEDISQEVSKYWIGT